MTGVVAVVLQVAALTVAYRIHRAYTAPAEDGESHREEPTSSDASPQ